MTPPLVLASASEEDTVRLSQDGPRRDFVELATELGGTILYSERRSARGGILGKLWGPHVAQAWKAAAMASPGQVLFADGEHNGIPLLLFLALRARRRQRVVMLGHFVSKPWKRALLALATRLVPRGALVLHSLAQRERVNGVIGPGWEVHLVPYHVDTAFWQPSQDPAQEGPLFVAVGAENRDYTTLLKAAPTVDAQVVVAGASHWARDGSAHTPEAPNVRFYRTPLGYGELRSLYSKATAVVVPLKDVENQSGITTILEAMSMRLPVVVAATRGQREAVRGPIVGDDGTLDPAGLADRGPHFLIPELADTRLASGLYVRPESPEALAIAMNLLIRDRKVARLMGCQGRSDVSRHFDTSQFVARLSAIIQAQSESAGNQS